MDVTSASKIIGLPPDLVTMPVQERRQWALKLRGIGVTASVVAKMVGVHRKTVWQWCKDEQEKGSPVQAGRAATTTPNDIKSEQSA